MIIERAIESQLKEAVKYFAVVAILGPRQSGKTTIARTLFAKHTYINLEDIPTRKYAIENPKGFLEQYYHGDGIILDEFQHAPDILSYIQVLVDEKYKASSIILAGSHNFLMNKHISQSLAGRVSINTLPPLSIHELAQADLLSQEPESLIYKGSYPPVYARNIPPIQWYPGYVKSYLERDLRDLTQVDNLVVFRKFMELCAGRAGQLVNVSSLAMDCSIGESTAKRWLNLLETSYIIFMLRPYRVNYNKRIIKIFIFLILDLFALCLK